MWCSVPSTADARAYLTLFAATFVMVAGRVFQQLNVVHEDYWLMPLASYGMAYSELVIALTGAIAVSRGRSWVLVGFATGTGGAVASVVTTWLYQ